MTSEASGVVGSIAYDYWFADEWAFSVSLGVANANASTSVTGSGVFMESATVIPLLFGVKYKPIELAVGDALRPYLYAALGPYFGFASDVRSGTTTGTEAYSETALGSRAGVGMDLSLSRSFKLGFAVGYRFVSDFARRIGSDENYSSPEFSLSIGALIGKGK
jgi:outer membrane protein W